MKVFKKIALLIVFTAVVFIGFSFIPPIPDKGCINEVYQIYKNMNPNATSEGNVYMNYTQTTHFKKKAPSDSEQSKTTVECVIGKNQIHYKSNEIAVYIDSVDNFTVVPIRKMVFWSNSTLKKGKQDERIKGIGLLQDSLFAVCHLLSCTTESNIEKGYNKIVAMAPNEKSTDLFPYKKLTFYINTLTQTIKKIDLELLPAYDYTSIELVYNKIELNYQKENLKTPVKQLFFASNNQLKGNYKSYKLVDNRFVASKNGASKNKIK